MKLGTKAAILVACIAIASCGQRGGPPPGAGGYSLPVSASPIKRGDIVTYFTVTGTVTPRQSASLSSVMSGTVRSVAAQIGEHVHAGEVLVQIDDSTLRSQQSQAAANLAQVQANNAGGSTTAQANLGSAKVAYETAAATLRRDESLFKQGYVSQSALDQARSQAVSAEAAYRSALVSAQNASLDTRRNSVAVSAVRSAQAALGAVESEIAQTYVRAPFDGVVTARRVDPGSLATPNTALMDVAQLDPLFVDVGLSGDSLAHVHVGTPVNVTITAAPGRTWHGKVAYLNLASVPGTSVYQARIELPNHDLALRAGMVATATFEQDRKPKVLLAPRAAVFQTDAGYAMFIIDAGKAKTLPIEVGLANDQVMEVTGPGLKPGVQAILNHSVLLQPGTPVQVMPPHGSGY